MRIEFLDPAKKEFTEAIAYYNQESEGLGYRFAVEVGRTLSRIVQYPPCVDMHLEAYTTL